MNKDEKKRRGQPRKSCEHQDPTIRVRVHTPEIRPVHPHLDATFTVKRESDYEVWAETCRTLLVHMGITADQLVVGFIMDFINGLPVEIRELIWKGIFLGWGCEVGEPEEDGSVYVRQVQRYPPLAGPEERPSGLVIPGRDEPGGALILPE